MRTGTRVYYKIRFLDKVGTHAEWYNSNNGTNEWGELKQIKALISRGRPYGYRSLVPFENYEVVEITEKYEIYENVVRDLNAKFKP